MATIAENIEALMGTITMKLNQNPTVKYTVEDVRRTNQAVGGRIVVRHPEYPDFDAGILYVGSAVLESRGAKRAAQPQEYYDNLLEVKSDVMVSPKYMFKWLEQGTSMEVSFRQSKPDAKVRVETLAEQISKWAHVLMQVTPEHVTEWQEKQRVAQEATTLRIEESRLEELKKKLEEARQEARDRQMTESKESLLREYGELLYENTGTYYGEDFVKRAQRTRVQSAAGFQLDPKTRRTDESPVDDARAWFELDNTYCRPFSVGEIRAMMDALRIYRAATSQDEWLPRVPTGEEEIEVQDAAEDEEPEAPAELSASMLLSVPLPEQMDD